MTNDLIQTIKVGLSERLTNPLVSTFLISTIVINYQFFIIIISSIPLTYKTQLLNEYISRPSILFSGESEITARIFNLVIYPFLLSLIYLLFVPVISYPVYYLHFWLKKKLNELRKTIQSQELLTKEEASTIEARAEQISDKNSALKIKITDIENQNDSLLKQIKELQSKLEDQDSYSIGKYDVEKIASTFKEDIVIVEDILQNINLFDKSLKQDALLNHVNENKTKTLHTIDEMLIQGLISQNTSEDGMFTYDITPLGRKLMINQGWDD